MSFKWQDNHMEVFLETYKKYECLWNTKCIDYSKSKVREKAYAMMLQDLNIPKLTVADVKAKIKTVRTRYGAELTKIRNSELNKDSTGEVYQPRLFWFKDADRFLRNVCSPKPTNVMSTTHENQKEICDTIDKTLTEHTEGNESDSQDISTSFPNHCDTSKYPKNKLKHSLPSTCPQIESTVKKFKQNPKEDEIINNEGPNEFDYFCESLAIQLKRMPLKRAIICQEKLQNVMTQERLFQLSDPFRSLLSATISPNDYLEHSLKVDTENQSSDDSMMSTPGSRLDSTTENDTNEVKKEEESDSECIPEIKTEED